MKYRCIDVSTIRRVLIIFIETITKVSFFVPLIPNYGHSKLAPFSMHLTHIGTTVVSRTPLEDIPDIHWPTSKLWVIKGRKTERSRRKQEKIDFRINKLFGMYSIKLSRTHVQIFFEENLFSTKPRWKISISISRYTYFDSN